MTFVWPGTQPPSPESLRAALAQHDAILAALQSDLVRAEQADGEYRQERAALEEALAAAKAGFSVSIVDDGASIVAESASAPRAVLRRVEAAWMDLKVLDSQRQRWLQQAATTTLDASPGVDRSCHPDSIRQRIARTTTARGQIEHQLADALARQLAEREQAEQQVASMPEAAGVRSELAKLRSRLGLG